MIGNWVNKFNLKNVEEYFDENQSNVPLDIQAFSKFTDAALSEIDKVKLSPTNHNFLTHSLRLKTMTSMRKQGGTPVFSPMSQGTGRSSVRPADYFSPSKDVSSPSNNPFFRQSDVASFEQRYREKTAAGTARPRDLGIITQRKNTFALIDSRPGHLDEHPPGGEQESNDDSDSGDRRGRRPEEECSNVHGKLPKA